MTAPLHGSRKVSPVLRLAQTWGCQGRVARERMERCFRDAADVVVALMSAGEGDRLAAKMAPLDAALVAWMVAPTHDEAVRASGHADTHEDNAEMEYALNPCRDSARALVKASAAERLRAEQREAALIAKWEI